MSSDEPCDKHCYKTMCSNCSYCHTHARVVRGAFSCRTMTRCPTCSQDDTLCTTCLFCHNCTEFTCPFDRKVERGVDFGEAKHLDLAFLAHCVESIVFAPNMVDNERVQKIKSVLKKFPLIIDFNGAEAGEFNSAHEEDDDNENDNA